MWDAAGVDRDALLRDQLVEAACRTSALVWVRRPEDSHASALWHVLAAGAVHVVGGGAEQPLPAVADGDRLEVTVRSKDTGGRLLRFAATVHHLAPGTPEWDAVVPELHAKRLNPPDGEAQPARWARESAVLRLDPVGTLLEGPGHHSHRSHAAEPPGSPATTRGPLPFVLGRRARRRR